MQMRGLLKRALLPLFLIIGILYAFLTLFHAPHDAKLPKEESWSFDGFTSTFDRASLQRGFQVYKEVCSSCHSLSRVRFRNLSFLGFSEAEIEALASEFEVDGGLNEEGEPFMRKARPGDSLPSPYKNDIEARNVNNGSLPVDLSLIVKARAGGADYVYSLLTGYASPPKEIHMFEGKSYNPYFPGGQISMPPPLIEGMVSYSDGTPATIPQMAKDVTTFLAWAAEPEMESRKKMGVKVLLYLMILTVLLYLCMTFVWSRVKG